MKYEDYRDENGLRLTRGTLYSRGSEAVYYLNKDWYFSRLDKPGVEGFQPGFYSSEKDPVVPVMRLDELWFFLNRC
mgnify:CR=1 FL=1|jgi:hypothetical protein